jgi:hypothetical protein
MGFRGGSYAKELGGVICGETKEQTLNAIPTNPTFTPFSVNIYEFKVK